MGSVALELPPFLPFRRNRNDFSFSIHFAHPVDENCFSAKVVNIMEASGRTENLLHAPALALTVIAFLLVEIN